MKPSRSFAGFAEGPQRITPIPSLFITEALPAIDHLGELKVTLYVFWALSRQQGRFRYLTMDMLKNDRPLLEGLGAKGLPGEEALEDALERATGRGTLLRVSIEYGQGTETLFFLNSSKGRAAVASIERGEWRPGSGDEEALALHVDRPNIFALYEQNIGPLTPMLADLLREAEDTYPAAWIGDAFRIAVENNVRKWNYIQAILQEWHEKGRDERKDRGDTEKARRRYVEGEYSDFIEH